MYLKPETPQVGALLGSDPHQKKKKKLDFQRGSPMGSQPFRHPDPNWLPSKGKSKGNQQFKRSIGLAFKGKAQKKQTMCCGFPIRRHAGRAQALALSDKTSGHGSRPSPHSRPAASSWNFGVPEIFRCHFKGSFKPISTPFGRVSVSLQTALLTTSIQPF